MPYDSIKSLPKSVKVLPKHAQEIFRKAFNNSIEKYGEERAFKIAWGAVKNAGYEKRGDVWVKVTSLVYINEGPAQAITLAVVPSTEETEAQELVWHPVIYVGCWDHLSYGEFEVKLSDLQEMVSNFEAGVPLQAGVPIDEDGVHDVRSEGAFGWVEKLEIRGDALWAGIKWTQDGVAAIEDGRYKYLSASFYIGENPYAKTSMLQAGALCTRPFFRQQPELQIAASEYNYVVEDEDAAITQTGGLNMNSQEARAKYVELKGEVTDEDWEKIVEGVETEEEWVALTATFAEEKGEDDNEDKGGEESLEKQLADAQAKVKGLEESVTQEQEAKDEALAATQKQSERIDVLERENKEAKLSKEIAAVDLGKSKRYSPAAVRLLVAAQINPGEESIKAMQAHMKEHSGSMDTVIMGEAGAVNATTATGELSDEQWLEQKQITDETKKEVKKIAATEKIGFRKAYDQIIDARVS